MTNSLSRRPNWKVGVDKNNENQVFIKDCWLYSLHKAVIEGLEINIVEKMKKARGKDEKIVRVVEEMKKVGIRALRDKEWQLERDLVLKEEKVYCYKS